MRSRLVWTLVDQAFSSGRNFVLIFLLARGSSPVEFGTMMIGYAVFTAGVAISRNAFGGILGIDVPIFSKQETALLLGRSMAGVIAVGTLTGLLVATYANFAPGMGEGVVALLILACFAPIVLAQDLQRFHAVAAARVMHAGLADGLWFILGCATLLTSILAGLPDWGLGTAGAGVLLWGGSAALSAIVLALCGHWSRPRFMGLVDWMRGDARRFHLGGDALLSSVSPLVTSMLIAALGGAHIVGAVRGAGTMFGPLNLITATFPLALVPEAIRAGPQRAMRLYVLAISSFTVLSLGWGAVLWVLPSAVGAGLLGETWTLVRGIILVTAWEYVGLGVWAVARSRLRVQGRVRTAFRLRVAFTAATILSVPAVLTFSAKPISVAFALAIVSIILAGAGWLTAQSHVDSRPS